MNLSELQPAPAQQYCTQREQLPSFQALQASFVSRLEKSVTWNFFLPLSHLTTEASKLLSKSHIRQ